MWHFLKENSHDLRGQQRILDALLKTNYSLEFNLTGKYGLTNHHMVIEAACVLDAGTYVALLVYSNKQYEVNIELEVQNENGTLLTKFVYNSYFLPCSLIDSTCVTSCNLMLPYLTSCNLV